MNGSEGGSNENPACTRILEDGSLCGNPTKKNGTRILTRPKYREVQQYRCRGNGRSHITTQDDVDKALGKTQEPQAVKPEPPEKKQKTSISQLGITG